MRRKKKPSGSDDMQKRGTQGGKGKKKNIKSGQLNRTGWRTFGKEGKGKKSQCPAWTIRKSGRGGGKKKIPFLCRGEGKKKKGKTVAALTGQKKTGLGVKKKRGGMSFSGHTFKEKVGGGGGISDKGVR